MKNMYVTGISLSFFVLLALACNEKKEAAAPVVVDKEEIKKAIQAKEDSFANLYNTGELKEIGYYADDAISFYQNRAPLVGRESIVNFLKENISVSSDKISFKTNEVFVSNDGMQVIEVGSFKVVDSLNNPFNTGNYMTLFEKRNGKYVAVRDMSASDSIYNR